MIASRGDVADLERSAQTCVDHSILAILEDSSVAPEVSGEPSKSFLMIFLARLFLQ